jgi:GNAT superfamily N-acetyltransferase
MAHDVTLRLAAPSERQVLEALQLRASLQNAGDREAIERNPDAIHLPGEQISAGQVFVAEVAGTVIGFAVVLRRADGDAELDGLFVEPAVWKRGVGRLLVNRCCKYARSNGAANLHVIGNPHAEGFYLACGFENGGTQETRFGIGLLMKKPL